MPARPVSLFPRIELSSNDASEAEQGEALVLEVARQWSLDPERISELRRILTRAPTIPTPSQTWNEEVAHAEPSIHHTEFQPADSRPDAFSHAPTAEDRYEDLGRIGSGGMGEVRRVRDRKLRRIVAMKVIRDEYKSHPRALARFLEEAQVGAQLDHPGIVPVHDLGRLADGRFFFTMQEVHGRTLTTVLHAVHSASPGETWGRTEDGWTLRRLTEAFHRVCEAVAYAHARKVLHRDLKPENIMLGTYGEVMVMDWGLAKVLGEASADDEPETPITVDLTAGMTRTGTVAGTPAYMPPEQARGELDRLDERADVYALGAILYELLDGSSPYPGRRALERVLAGPPRPLAARALGRRRKPGPSIPTPLRKICAKAMSREADDRYRDAGAMAEALGQWLEGARRRELALAFVAKADQLEPEVQALRDRAAKLRSQASSTLRGLSPTSPPEEKREAWGWQDSAARLELRAELLHVEVVQHLRAALAEAPDTAEAHSRLAAHYQARHVDAVARRDTRGQAALEALLRSHDTGAWSDYLEGEGQLTLRTRPAAHATLLRIVERDRRLVTEHDRALGPTPLRNLILPHGPWVIELRSPNGPTIRYPIHLERQQEWDGSPPGADHPHVVELPDEVGENERFLPAGPTWVGGDRQAPGSGPRSRMWVNSVIMMRDPLTNAEYLEFLTELVRAGERERALRYAPRLGGLLANGGEGLQFVWTGSTFTLGDKAPNAPVTHVDWESACAYAAWLAERTGRPWRLPTEHEWEKAARGVDGRFYPWGDDFDPSFCRIRSLHRIERIPDPIDHWPLDESPYGVRGTAGNCREWCADVFTENGVSDPSNAPPSAARAVRGGSWNRDERWARLAARDWELPETRSPDVGFRLARSV